MTGEQIKQAPERVPLLKNLGDMSKAAQSIIALGLMVGGLVITGYKLYATIQDQSTALKAIKTQLETLTTTATENTAAVEAVHMNVTENAGKLDDLGTKVTSNTAALDHVTTTVNDNSESVDDLSAKFSSIEKKLEAIQPNRKPAIMFADYGHSIAPGQPGEVVMITLRFKKLRADCSAPTVQISQVDAENASLSVALVDFLPEIRPAGGGYQEISYPIRLSARAAPGLAKSRVSVKHPCIEGDPDPVISPVITSRILTSE